MLRVAPYHQASSVASPSLRKFSYVVILRHHTNHSPAGHVISIGSFAKILAPGMRLGWLQTSKAAEPLLKKIYNCGQLDSSGALNPVISGIVHTMIDNGMQKTHLAAVRAELTKRACGWLGRALG